MIDMGSVTAAVAEGAEAVAAVLGALIYAYATWTGLRIVKRFLVGENDGFDVESLSDDELDDLWANSEDLEEYQRKRDIIDDYWESEDTDETGNRLWFYDWAELKGIEVGDIEPEDVY